MTERAFADRVLLPVTAAIYQNRWRRETSPGAYVLPWANREESKQLGYICSGDLKEQEK